MAAALKGATQIGFTIISLTVSLIAVLIPLLFMGDVVGRLFREFAVTLAITILISAVVSLTLVPMMSARWLKPHPARRTLQEGQPCKTGIAARLTRIARRCFDGVMTRYDRGLHWVIAHQAITLVVALITMVLTVVLYLTIPKGLFPTQDTSQLQGRVEAAQDVVVRAHGAAAAGGGARDPERPRGREPELVRRRRCREQHDAAHRQHADQPGQEPRRSAGRDHASAQPRARGGRRHALPAADARPDDRRRDRADRVPRLARRRRQRRPSRNG